MAHAPTSSLAVPPAHALPGAWRGRRIAPGATALRAGALGVGLALAGNAVMAVLAAGLGAGPPGYPPFALPTVLAFTVIQGGGAVPLFWLFGRQGWSLKAYVAVAVAALLLSFGPDVGLLLAPDRAPFPGSTPTAVAALMFMHVVAFAAIVGSQLRWGTAPGEPAPGAAAAARTARA